MIEFYVLAWETKEAFVCVESPYRIHGLANRWGYESFNICMINRRSNKNLYRVQNQHSASTKALANIPCLV